MLLIFNAYVDEFIESDDDNEDDVDVSTCKVQLWKISRARLFHYCVERGGGPAEEPVPDCRTTRTTSWKVSDMIKTNNNNRTLPKEDPIPHYRTI